MSVNKFSISLPEGLLADVDELARVEDMTRSAVIREGMTAYIAGRRSSRQQQARMKSIDEAMSAFELVAQDWGSDELDGVDYLRDLRGETSSDPLEPLGSGATGDL